MRYALLLFLLVLTSAETQSRNVTRITAYNAVASQGWGDPSKGYCKGPRGDYRLPVDAIALSDSLLRVYPCGSRVRVTTAAGRVIVGTVADKMNSQRYGSVAAVDVRMRTYQEARQFGVQRGRIERVN